MSLKALIATPGEIAAARITRDFDFNSHDAHERLFAAIKEAVDGAAGFSPVPGKTDSAELVTEEMITKAAEAYELATVHNVSMPSPLIAALRAVAPMIAARAVIDKGYRDLQAWRDGNEAGRSAERERCAHTAAIMGANSVAAAIRARGATP